MKRLQKAIRKLGLVGIEIVGEDILLKTYSLKSYGEPIEEEILDENGVSTRVLKGTESQLIKKIKKFRKDLQ